MTDYQIYSIRFTKDHYKMLKKYRDSHNLVSIAEVIRLAVNTLLSEKPE